MTSSDWTAPLLFTGRPVHFAHSLFTYGVLKSQMGLPPAIDHMLKAKNPNVLLNKLQ